MGECADHAQTPAVFGVLVLVLGLGGRGRASVVWRTSLNEDHWKPALAKVGVVPQAKSREHAAAREHGMHALRHFYASALLDSGESIKALAECLGHSDPGLTSRVYTHLMPSSRGRARKALGRALRPYDPGH